MEINNRYKKRASLILTLCCLSLLLLTALIYKFVSDYYEGVNQSREQAESSSFEAAREVDKKMVTLTQWGTQIAEDIHLGVIDETDALKAIKRRCLTDPNIRGGGIFYSDLSYTYYVKKEKVVEKINLDQWYNYKEQAWFNEPFYQNKTYWSSTTKEATNACIVVKWSVPFFISTKKGDQKKGVLLIDISCEAFQSIIDDLGLPPTSLGFIIGGEGFFMAHPDREYVFTQKTIFDLAQLPGKNEFRRLGERALKGKKGLVQHSDSADGKMLWVAYESTKIFPGAVFISTLQPDLFKLTDRARRQLNNIALSVTLSLFLLFLLIFQAYRGEIIQLWYSAIFLSFLFCANIFLAWIFQSYSIYSQKNTKEVRITDKATLTRFLDFQNRINRKLKKEPIIYLPTGLWVQSINFSNSSEVIVKGMIWQKYQNNLEGKISQNITIENCKTFDLKERYRKQELTEEVIGWEFSALFKSSDRKQYPLDRSIITLMISHDIIDQNIVLSPDFESYTKKTFGQAIGIDEKIKISSWHLDDSFYSYQVLDNATNFGIKNHVRQKEFPYMTLNIVLDRQFAIPLISSISPIIVLSITLFSLLTVMGRKVGNVTDSFTQVVLMVSSAIFLSTLVGHRKVNDLVSSDDISYIESFYFAVYVMVIFTMISCLAIAGSKPLKFFTYRKNLIARLLFWPTLTGIILTITLIVFY